MQTYTEAAEYTAPDVEAALRANSVDGHVVHWCYYCNKLLAEKAKKGTVIVCSRCKTESD